MLQPKTDDYSDTVRKTHHAVTTESMHDKGLHTGLNHNRDYEGNPVKNRKHVERMRIWNDRITAQSGTDRRMLGALTRHREIIAYLVVPKPIAEASTHILRRLIKCAPTKGTSHTMLCAVAIYWAYRTQGVNFNVRTMTDRLGIRGGLFLTRCLDYGQRLNLQRNDSTDEIVAAVHKISNKLNLKRKASLDAVSLVQIARKMMPAEISSKTPAAIAAATLYLVTFGNAKYSVAQEDYAVDAGISTVTIRNSKKILRPALEKMQQVQDFKVHLAEFRGNRV